MISFLLHLAFLIVPGLWLGRALRLSFAPLIAATFLIFELSLVLGSSLLSCVSLVGHLRIYQVVTTLCAIAIAALIKWIAGRGVPPTPVSSGIPRSDRVSASLATALRYALPASSLLIFAVLLLVLAANAYPSVEDSLTVKLPKIIFSLQSNSILPSDFTDDGRMYISPVYPTLVQMFFIINGQKGHALLVFGFVNWVVCAVALYRVCLEAGATKVSSLTVTALMMLTPTLLTQGASEGDDLMAHTPFVIGLMFSIPAIRERNAGYAILAGIGLALSVAMKLLPLFYVPALMLVVALLVYSRGLQWLRARIGAGLWLTAAFVFTLLPNAITNWIMRGSFGNPLYASDALRSAQNWPFNLECAARSSVGHLKQLFLTDMIRLVPRVALNSSISALNDLFTRVLPFDPPPGCTAYGVPYELTSPWVTDNTMWFGVVGPLLLISGIIVIVSPTVPPAARALGFGFLAWIFIFDFTQKYYGQNGRYWAMAALAGAPAIAAALDLFNGRRVLRRYATLVLIGAGVTTVFLGWIVLRENSHRNLADSLRQSRYVAYFPTDFASFMAKTRALNIQVMYGINTYDFYMLLGPNATLFNKTAVLDDVVNVVPVRPYGVLDNPFFDPRFPVRMKRPFPGGFRLFEVPFGQLPFTNNTELVGGADLDPRSLFLIFEIHRLKIDAESVSGWMYQIASPAIVSKVRYRIGWRNADGALEMLPEWRQGVYSEFKVPVETDRLVIEAGYEGDAETSSLEWPMKRVDPKFLKTLNPVAGQ